MGSNKRKIVKDTQDCPQSAIFNNNEDEDDDDELLTKLYEGTVIIKNYKKFYQQ